MEEREHKSIEQIADEVFGKGNKKPIKKADYYFSKFPHWVIDSGVLGILRPKALKVYAVLLRYADFNTGNGRVGNKKISKLSNVNQKSVSACISDLKRYELINTWRKGWVRYYQIKNRPPSNIVQIVEFFKKDKSPRNMDTYNRDSKTGVFSKKEVSESIPENTESLCPKNMDSA